MPGLSILLLLGAVAGLIASAVMEAFQTLAAKPFGQTGSDDPSTVKLADRMSRALTGAPVTQRRRMAAGRLVHYATGTMLGMIFVVGTAAWPTLAIGFGVAYGLAAAIALDYIAVPALGLGAPAWRTPLATHAYSLIAHAIFGAALEAVREIGFRIV